MQKIIFCYWKNKKIPKAPSSVWQLWHVYKLASDQSWALSVFLNVFSYEKWFFAYFIGLTWLGAGFFNKNVAEMGYYLHKKCKKSFFIIEILKNTESAQLWTRPHLAVLMNMLIDWQLWQVYKLASELATITLLWIGQL